MKIDQLRSITPREKIWSRNDTLPYLKVREWEFQKMGKGMILRKHGGKGESLEVRSDETLTGSNIRRITRRNNEAKLADTRRHHRRLLNLPIEYYLPDIKIGRPGFALDQD